MTAPKCLYLLLLLTLFSAVYGQSDVKKKSIKSKNTSKVEKYTSYLFVYFIGDEKKTGKDGEEIRFALSKDGYHFKALNNNQPILDSKKISLSGGVRDPHILRAEDGKTFYMVATDMVSAMGWDSNRGMVLMKSTNLIDWQSTAIHVPTVFPEFSAVLRVWAPQTIYDDKTKKYMVYWSMKTGNEPDKIYYAYANKDFTGFETHPKQLFFSPTNNACIDAEIIKFKDKYHLFFKTEDQKPGIKKAVSTSLTEGYQLESDQYLQQTTDPVEGAGVFKLNNSDEWILMYDVYTKGRYQFTISNNLSDFKAIDNEVIMDFHPRHGTVMPITDREAKALFAKWKSKEDKTPIVNKE